MDGGADVVDRNAAGGYEAGELKHLVEVALSWEWDDDHCDLGWFNGNMVITQASHFLFYLINFQKRG